MLIGLMSNDIPLVMSISSTQILALNINAKTSKNNKKGRI